MPINDEHPSYIDMADRWQRCRDVAAGSDSVKAAGRRYLPRPSGMEHLGEYAAYISRASFFNAMSRSIDGLAGAIFQKPPVVTVPPAIESFLPDISLADESFDMLALDVTREVLTVGRAVVLVDMGTESIGNRPYMLTLGAENLISWKTERRGGDSVLVRAVLREVVERADEDDESRIRTDVQYRELALSDDGFYIWRIHVRLPRAHLRDANAAIWIPTEWETPSRRGDPLPFIPLTVINASGLGVRVGRPPLIDLADVNLSHYRSSADREHSLHFVSMPTPWVSGLKGDGKLKIGSSVAWELAEGGRAGMLEHSGEGIGAIRENMEEKTRQMAALGARLLEEQPRTQETATAVGMRHSGEQASLRTIASVVDTGLSQALRRVAWWAGTKAAPADVKASVELNKDFMATKLTARELQALVSTWQSDGMSWETLHANLARGGVMRPDVSAEEEQAAIVRGGGGTPPRLELGNGVN